MQLMINGNKHIPKPDQTLLEIIQEMNMDSNVLSKRPLAAKIAGEVFNLNYIPVRQKDAQQDRISIRRAMAASGGNIQLLYYDDPAGRDAYIRTAQFVLFMALHKIWPNARGKINCTVGEALLIEVFGAEDFSVDKLKDQVSRLQKQNIPLLRRRVATSEAKKWFSQNGRTDKARLLDWRKEPYFDLYTYDDFSDYYYGELMPSTGYLQVWDIIPAGNGFLFIYPDQNNPDRISGYKEMPRFLSVSIEGKRWCEWMECETIADLNDMVLSGKIRELIRVNEALHEKRFAQAADSICNSGRKVVLLAGPSSSGKTTSANRLAAQLRVHGKRPVLISLDDYYMDRDKIEPGPDGKLDLEHINTIDTDLFSKHIKTLLSGGEVALPTFNFLTGKREFRGNMLSFQSDTIIIVEGLHALNPTLLPADIDGELVFKLYVSPLLPICLDDHNRIPSNLLRLLRRIVRDYETRGSSVEKTIEMWDLVRRGEKRWIFPYQENADMFFNSSTLYELPVLKKHIFPLLTAVEPENSSYETARAIVKVLNYVLTADVDDEIPPTSLVREFIGGNSFYKS